MKTSCSFLDVVDVVNLKIGEAIHVKDIKVSEGIKILHEPDVVVLSVAAPVKEEEAVAEEGAVEGEAASQEPEVIKKEKKEEEETKEEGAEKKAE